MATSFQERPKISVNVVATEDLNKRIKQVRMDGLKKSGDSEKVFSVGLYDIDESLKYFFENVISPTVVENNEKINVPVLYGNQERWNSMKQQGYYRDGKSKLVLPLIMYKRNNISQNEQLQFPRVDDLYHISKIKWDKNNRYDNFSILSKQLSKSNKYALTSIPNYIVLTYDVILWTSYIEQLNDLAEQVLFYRNTYWGDKSKFLFRTDIDSIDSVVEISTGQERLVRSNMTLTTNGYVLPESVGSKMTTKMSISSIKLNFNGEIEQ